MVLALFHFVVKNTLNSVARTVVTADEVVMYGLEAIDGLNTLIDYRYTQHFKAKRGDGGMGRDRHGKDGQDVILKVPLERKYYQKIVVL